MHAGGRTAGTSRRRGAAAGSLVLEWRIPARPRRSRRPLPRGTRRPRAAPQPPPPPPVRLLRRHPRPFTPALHGGRLPWQRVRLLLPAQLAVGLRAPVSHRHPHLALGALRCGLPARRRLTGHDWLARTFPAGHPPRHPGDGADLRGRVPWGQVTRAERLRADCEGVWLAVGLCDGRAGANVGGLDSHGPQPAQLLPPCWGCLQRSPSRALAAD
mmetsp:Transcript_10388/g.34382  ORF Transcript_10388/g.34382 Transcript_10388/m.34382 type:complete len:214 (+) Transcript_10388:248-889(+)